MTIEFQKSSTPPKTNGGSNGRTAKVLPIFSQPAPTTTPMADLADVDVEAELRKWEDAERERIGVKAARKQWVDTMTTPTVRKSEREHITILNSGLTAAQDFLVEGALSGLGYTSVNIGAPDNVGLQLGKEFGNRGQCNPTYFTVGNLVKYLTYLRDEKGLSVEQIKKDYIFLTAGACGPCRFGMYVTEYRKALRDAGFDGFRVMLFQQQGGLSQASGEDCGIEFNPDFFIAIIKAIVCGDVLNAIGYRIRPYEVVAGETDRVLEEAKRRLWKSLAERTNIFKALLECRSLFARIQVDKLRAKPKVSIIGEFWAMTTEGDGNYQLQKFLESENGENDIQLTTAWLLYNIWEIARDTRERAELRGEDGGKYGLQGMADFDVAKRMATMRIAEIALRGGFQTFANAGGLHDYHLPDMDLVAKVAHEYYSNDLRGGEGHMEVGKLIVNSVKNKAHLTVSVKPFGCMPSSGVSDGVQSLITARYPGSIYCAVETSGDGAANFYSRVQMYAFKARILAEEELKRAYQDTGLTEAQVRAWLVKHPKYASPLHHSPHKVAGSAANLVYEVAPLIMQSRAQRATTAARRLAARSSAIARAIPAQTASLVTVARTPEFRERLREDARLIRDIVGGKVRERFAPLVSRLTERAAQ